jgi:CheY-like chemotaxis protein
LDSTDDAARDISLGAHVSRYLVVDDDHATVRILGKLLENDGYVGEGPTSAKPRAAAE